MLSKRNQISGLLFFSNTLPKESIAILDEQLAFGRLLSENRLADAAIRHTRAKQIRDISESDDSNNVKKILGQHVLGEFFLTQPFNITAGFLRKIFLFAAKKAGATILTSHFMDTAAGGISGVVVIAESHFIIHFFPSQNYLALDIYTCGEMNTNLALDYIIQALNLAPYDQINFQRGVIGSGHRLSKCDTNGSFFPGLAYKKGSMLHFFNATSNSTAPTQERTPIAHHCVGELYCSDIGIINNRDQLLKAFYEAFDTDFEFSYIKEFNPQGISLVLMNTNGIHVTTHPWPELNENYTPVDVFVSTESGINAREAIERLVGLLHSQRYTIEEFPRGVRDTTGKLTPILTETAPTAENSHSLRM